MCLEIDIALSNLFEVKKKRLYASYYQHDSNSC